MNNGIMNKRHLIDWHCSFVSKQFMSNFPKELFSRKIS